MVTISGNLLTSISGSAHRVNLACEGLLLGKQAGGPTEIPTSRLTLTYRMLTSLHSAIRITTHLCLFCRTKPSSRRSPNTKSFTRRSLGISGRLHRRSSSCQRPQGGHGLQWRSSACRRSSCSMMWHGGQVSHPHSWGT
jgi:hypothetical protein